MLKQAAAAGAAILFATAFGTRAFADAKTVTGTLEDSFCYVTMGAHGEGHRKCATECVKKCIPVALVEKGSDTMYILLPPKNDEPLPDDVINKMEHEVTISGDAYSKGGVNYLTVKSVK